MLLQTAPVISGREHSVSWGDFGSQAFDIGADKHQIWIYNSNNVFTCAKKKEQQQTQWHKHQDRGRPDNICAFLFVTGTFWDLCPRSTTSDQIKSFQHRFGTDSCG